MQSTLASSKHAPDCRAGYLVPIIEQEEPAGSASEPDKRAFPCSSAPEKASESLAGTAACARAARARARAALAELRDGELAVVRTERLFGRKARDRDGHARAIRN